MPEDTQEQFWLTVTKGEEWFTDKSPLFYAIKTGVMYCNGKHKCMVREIFPWTDHVISKDGIRGLQDINCNCNDCGHLLRLLEKQNSIVANNKSLQEQIFDITKERKISKIKNDIENLIKHKGLIRDAEGKIKSKTEHLRNLESSKFHFQNDRTPIQYGVCKKFEREITFVPNTCQIETQGCFTHRKSPN